MRCGALDGLMIFITRLGDRGMIWIASALLLMLFPKTRRLGASAALALALELVCCNFILKPVFARPRPFTANPAAELIIKAPRDMSFPSGHAGSSFAAASALAFGKSRLCVPALVLAVLVALSRVYLYVHYPSDVLAGSALGVLLGFAADKIIKKSCL